ERMQRMPNTRAAHRLIQLAQDQGRAGPVVDGLFAAYFEAARDIGDPQVLADIASKCGVMNWPNGADAEKVTGLEEEVRALGISAVPTFIFDRRLGVAGAHPPQSLADAMREAVQT